jgi:hypothetical protein
MIGAARMEGRRKKSFLLKEKKFLPAGVGLLQRQPYSINSYVNLNQLPPSFMTFRDSLKNLVRFVK